ncbi:hypothetical protein [Patulibacter defluvii]|uniref:hypothetical protein n=1 Tax=Patulibacter defluvii TaxID=3095358 RepID=UPI002A75EC67|nr:hypothetical protein [Patulibacter sp. DM4]
MSTVRDPYLAHADSRRQLFVWVDPWSWQVQIGSSIATVERLRTAELLSALRGPATSATATARGQRPRWTSGPRDGFGLSITDRLTGALRLEIRRPRDPERDADLPEHDPGHDRWFDDLPPELRGGYAHGPTVVDWTDLSLAAARELADRLERLVAG